MKNIVKNTVAAGILNTLNEALGLKPADDPRMSVGSFVSNVLREFTGAVTLAICSEKILLVEGNFNQAQFGTNASLLYSAGTPPAALTFEAVSSLSKTKEITSPDFIVTQTVRLDGDPTTDPYLNGLLVPKVPSFTLLALINGILAIAEAEEELDSIILLVNQEDETVIKLKYPNATERAIASDRWDYTAFSVDGALLDLQNEATGDPVVRLGWE